MTSSDRQTGSLASLVDKEVEILHLLAAGHTVKSIAASLGRSEASINERLRDARRKTGVGSSRELARLVIAQKNWDRNIDLTKQPAHAEAVTQPHTAGRSWPKGTLIMLLALPLAAGLALTGPTALQRAAPAPAPSTQAAAAHHTTLAGQWALDVSKVPAEERPRRVTIAFKPLPDRKWTIIVEIVDPDGTTRRAESTAALDGVPVPIAGNMDFIDSGALRQPAPNTLVLTLGKNGSPVSTRVYTLAKDGKAMTETIVWAGSAMPKLETNHFNRIG